MHCTVEGEGGEGEKKLVSFLNIHADLLGVGFWSRAETPGKRRPTHKRVVPSSAERPIVMQVWVLSRAGGCTLKWLPFFQTLAPFPGICVRIRALILCSSPFRSRLDPTLFFGRTVTVPVAGGGGGT